MFKALSCHLRHATTRILDIIAPPQCTRCDAHLDDEHDTPHPLCDACRALLVPHDGPACSRCGQAPAQHADDLPHHGDLCESCIHFPPHYTEARAPFAYEGMLAELLSHIKYAKKELHMHELTALMLPFSEEQLATWQALYSPGRALLLVPMPMHWFALVRRGFSQTMILTRYVHAHTSDSLAEFSHLALIKTRHTTQQASLSLAARRTNLMGAFHADSRRVQGRTVVVIDDVITSGSSVNEAARTLLEAGAHKVLVLTLARTR